MRQVALFYLFSRVYIAYIYNKGVPNFGTPFELVEYRNYASSTAACAAAKRAIGTRNGEHDT